MLNKLLVQTVAILMVLTAQSANASLLVIGDVDVPGNSFESIYGVNYNFFEQVRDGASDILWLDGGSNFLTGSGRYTGLQSDWLSKGASITFDGTADIHESILGRDLIFIGQAYTTANALPRVL